MDKFFKITAFWIEIEFVLKLIKIALHFHNKITSPKPILI
ncbi:hypothetical protein FEM08_01200 [Flavobacterium gilvum]|nr:hypothetical protein FEM08_01200 [Flavobacterium gilvum]